jgi:hypothetical protein
VIVLSAHALQLEVHQAYLNNPNNNVPPASGLYNTTGRGYPDVAAIAMNGTLLSLRSLITLTLCSGHHRWR